VEGKNGIAGGWRTWRGGEWQNDQVEGKNGIAGGWRTWRGGEWQNDQVEGKNGIAGGWNKGSVEGNVRPRDGNDRESATSTRERNETTTTPLHVVRPWPLVGEGNVAARGGKNRRSEHQTMDVACSGQDVDT